MKKILATVDFSEASVNAAKYAVQLANDLPDTTLTLYYSYNNVTAGSDGSPLLVDEDDRKTIAEAAIQKLRNTLAAEGQKPIDYIVESGNIVANLEKTVKHQGYGLLVMGITGSSKLEQMVVGSTTLSVISRDICPVLVIPPTVSYHTIKRAALTSDLKDVERNTPVAQLTAVLSTIEPESLLIVNVTQEHHTVTEDNKAEKDKLEKLLADFNPQSYFILEENFDKAVADFAQEYKVDLIITVPKKHSFFAKLFKSSNTQRLAYNSQLPILAVHS